MISLDTSAVNHTVKDFTSNVSYNYITTARMYDLTACPNEEHYVNILYWLPINYDRTHQSNTGLVSIHSHVCHTVTNISQLIMKGTTFAFCFVISKFRQCISILIPGIFRVCCKCFKCHLLKWLDMNNRLHLSAKIIGIL